MIVIFEVYDGEEKKLNTIVVDDPANSTKTEQGLIKEVRYLVSEFKTHCALKKSSYHLAHFINYVNKYTNIRISYGFPQKVERLDM
jgi:hypothetical protein